MKLHLITLIILIVCLTSWLLHQVQAFNEIDCVNNIQVFAGMVFGTKCYSLAPTTDPDRYASAIQVCSDGTLGFVGQLVAITSAAINTAVAGIVGNAWIGTWYSSSAWRYMDGSTVTYTNWSGGAPQSTPYTTWYATYMTWAGDHYNWMDPLTTNIPAACEVELTCNDITGNATATYTDSPAPYAIGSNADVSCPSTHGHMKVDGSVFYHTTQTMNCQNNGMWSVGEHFECVVDLNPNLADCERDAHFKQQLIDNKDGDPVAIINNVKHLMDCGRYCGANPLWCQSMSYNTATQTCLLSNALTANLPNVTAASGYEIWDWA